MSRRESRPRQMESGWGRETGTGRRETERWGEAGKQEKGDWKRQRGRLHTRG